MGFKIGDIVEVISSEGIHKKMKHIVGSIGEVLYVSQHFKGCDVQFTPSLHPYGVPFIALKLIRSKDEQ